MTALATMTLEQLGSLTLDQLGSLTMDGSGGGDDSEGGGGSSSTDLSQVLESLEQLSSKADAIYGLLGSWSQSGSTLTTTVGNKTRTYTLTKTGGKITAVEENVTEQETEPVVDDYGGI